MSDQMESIHDIRLDGLFFSVGALDFCADAGQIESTALFDGDGAEELVWLHRELGYGASVEYLSPTILAIKRSGDLPYHLVVDRMTDITEIDARDIVPLPPLLEPFAMKRGIWGIIPREKQMVLMIDFLLLMRQKQSGVGEG